MGITIGRFLEVRTVRGKPFQVGERTLVPIAQTLSLAIVRPGAPMAGAFLWTRPIALEVVDPAGTRRFPIVDVGRRIALGLMAMAALPFLLRRLQERHRPGANG